MCVIYLLFHIIILNEICHKEGQRKSQRIGTGWNTLAVDINILTENANNITKEEKQQLSQDNKRVGLEANTKKTKYGYVSQRNCKEKIC
jgi:hypothetical protein